MHSRQKAAVRARRIRGTVIEATRTENGCMHGRVAWWGRLRKGEQQQAHKRARDATVSTGPQFRNKNVSQEPGAGNLRHARRCHAGHARTESSSGYGNNCNSRLSCPQCPDSEPVQKTAQAKSSAISMGQFVPEAIGASAHPAVHFKLSVRRLLLHTGSIRWAHCSATSVGLSVRGWPEFHVDNDKEDPCCIKECDILL